MFLAISISACSGQGSAPWIEFFDSESLNGWNSKGAEATYINDNGTFIGTTKADTPNTFLKTDKMYDVLF